MKFDVIVVGSGCAGVAAATKLAQQKKKVLVVEKSKILGGRTSSVVDKKSQEPVDNGQHMFLGCYTQTKLFLSRIHASNKVVFKDGFQTKMHGHHGENAQLTTYRLPAPLHLIVGYLRYGAFSFWERLSIIHVVFGLKRYSVNKLKKMSCSEFLNKCNQSQKTQDRFWNLLILATLNIAPDKAPASMLKVVLEQGFMSSRSDGASGLATIGLSELFGTLPQNFIEQHQGQVLVKSAVTDLIMEDQKVTGVIVNEQEKIYANHVIVTVPPNQLLKLIKKHKAFTQEKETLATMYSSPIVSLHLWTDQKLFDQAYVGFWDHDFHWAFRKQAFMEDTTIGHYTLVASGANHMVRMTTEQLTQKAYQALEPIGQSFTITRAKKSVMPHATWLFPLDSDCQPIDIQSTVSNLYFAGDWVDTGLPCTIESAVLSGHKAADLIVAKGL